MTKVSARFVVLSALLVTLTALPAAAQARSDTQMPVVMGLAQDGLLVTVAPLAFKGCSSGDIAYWQTSMPKLDLYSFFWVNDLGAPAWDVHLVVTRLGAVNVNFIGDAWIRVFRLKRGDLDDFRANPCEFYDRPHVAEGPGRLQLLSADDALVGPGANSWGYVLHGNLDDNGYCGGGSVRLSWLQRWISVSQTDLTIAKSTSSKGPTLTCR